MKGPGDSPAKSSSWQGSDTPHWGTHWRRWPDVHINLKVSRDWKQHHWPCFPCLGQTDWKHLWRIPLHWLWSCRHPGQSCSHSGRSPGLSQTPGLQVKKRVERSKTKTINKYQSLRYLDIVMPELLWGSAWRRPSSSSCLFGYLLISSAALPDRDQGTSVVLRSTPESEWVSGPLTNCLYPRIIHLRSDSLF